MKIEMHRKGFTLIELILVIALVGILAIAALPKFINLSQDVEDASMQGVAGAVRAGIALYRASDMVLNSGTGKYPTTLDSVAANTDCSTVNPCFTNVLTTGVDDSSWHKVSDILYQFDNGSVVTDFNYNPVNGTFD